MGRGNLRFYLLNLICIVLSLTSTAQSLPQLPIDSDFTVGVLPCGVKYYIIHNGAEKGFADFALVQKTGNHELVNKLALSSLPHFTEKEPYRFFAEKGVGYSENGYVSYRKNEYEDADIFDFRNLPVTDVAVSDTTMLLIFDLVALNPYEQAIIISGDIDTKQILDRMKVFSMMVQKRKKTPVRQKYEWYPRAQASFKVIYSDNDKTCISFKYISPRVPDNMINTVQSWVSDMFANELGFILKRRILMSFRKNEIPLSDLTFDYISSGDSAEDEKYILSYCSKDDDKLKSISLIASIFSDLDKSGADMNEYKIARREYMRYKLSVDPFKTNMSTVNKCISAFLYGSDLASFSSMKSFFSTRRVTDSQELEYFNKFVSALIKKNENLFLTCSTRDQGEYLEEKLENSFNSGWGTEKNRFLSSPKDTLSLAGFPSEKVRLVKTVSEPISGGELWTFSNGLQVIYKYMPSNKGYFDYAFLVRGGTSVLGNLSQGEAAFVGDILQLYDVGGLSANSFRNLLSANGITMKSRVSLADLTISGKSPSGSMCILMKSLLSLANDRSLSSNVYNYYKNSQFLELSVSPKKSSEIYSVLDNFMSPKDLYSIHKDTLGLTNMLPVKADKYFRSQFSNVNDGFFVIVGDIDSYTAKKWLCRSFGGFRTGRRRTIRPTFFEKVQSGIISSIDNAEINKLSEKEEKSFSKYFASAYKDTSFAVFSEKDEKYISEAISVSNNLSVKGDETFGMKFSSLLPFTSENVYACKIVSTILKQAFSGTAVEYGKTVECKEVFDILPKERFSISFILRPVSKNGVPFFLNVSDVFVIRKKLRSVISSVIEKGIKDEQLEKYKAFALNSISQSSDSPEGVINNVILRYAYGKDVISYYKDAVESITAEKILKILKGLEEGNKSEYIIK